MIGEDGTKGNSNGGKHGKAHRWIQEFQVIQFDLSLSITGQGIRLSGQENISPGRYLGTKSSRESITNHVKELDFILKTLGNNGNFVNRREAG